MSESLPKCKLCGSEPDTNWAPLVTRDDAGGTVTVSTEKFHCSRRSCTLNGVLCTEGQWRTLHDQSRCADLEAENAAQAEDIKELRAMLYHAWWSCTDPETRGRITDLLEQTLPNQPAQSEGE